MPMATNLFARSQNAAGLPRYFHTLSRSISVLLFGQGSSQAWVGRAEPGVGTGKQMGQHVGSPPIGLPASENVGSAMWSVVNTVTDLSVMKMPWVMGFSTHVAPIEEADPEVSKEKRGVNLRGDETPNLLKGGLRTKPESPLVVEKWRVDAQLREELLCSLRALPLDADLDKYIRNGIFAGAELTERDIGKVVSALTYNGRLKPAKFSPHLDLEEGDGSADVLVNTSLSRATVAGSGADKSAVRAYNTGDTKRALNLVNWWQTRDRNQVQPFALLHCVLAGLARANLIEDIVGIEERYKNTQHEGFHIASSLIAAYSIMGLSQKVVNIYSEARERHWPLTKTAQENVLRALVDLKVSTVDLLHMYKNTPVSFKFVMKSSAYALLLERGVRVVDICGTFFKCPTPIAARLIEALISLGRESEATLLISDLVNWQPPLRPRHLVDLLIILVNAGFSEEAQAIARMQKLKYEVSVANGLLEFLERGYQFQDATEKYQVLMKLEGPHKQCLAVHASAVRAYYAIGDVDGLYEVSFDMWQVRNWLR
jgi:hypothetical protein